MAVRKKAKKKAADKVQMDEFYADELTLQKNAEDQQERRLALDAAMIVWRLDDVESIFRHEEDVKWGWAMRRY
jgi:hypothetical protein